MKTVGIIPSTLGFNTNNPFDDKYYVQDTYLKRLKDIGLPIIIPPISLKIDEKVLDMCDSFLIIGGKNINEYHYQVIEYALKTNKKLLGICLGMQAIASYSNGKNELNTLYELPNHYHDNITHNKKELLVHNVTFNKNSILYELFGNNLLVNSIHKFAVKKVSYPFKVVGLYNNIIEAIEYKNIIGVQFHPELMKNTNELFKWLVE